MSSMANSPPNVTSGMTSSAWTVQSRWPPAARTDMRVRHASAPPMRATSSAPEAISCDVRFTSAWGVLPPALV
jgi:hypothetical protein